MRDLLYSIILGIFQGITEFIPVSSSGHLVLARSVLPGFEVPGLMFDVILHGGSLLAVFVYFKKDLAWFFKGIKGNLSNHHNTNAQSWVKGIIIGTIPAGLIGVLAHDWFENLFKHPLTVSFTLCCTGIILILGEIVQKRKSNRADSSDFISVKMALWVGCMQSLALIPGISRSGSTIAAGMAGNWSREKATRFSFLLMIPAVAGAVALKAKDVPQFIAEGHIDILALIAGFIASFLAGYLSIAFLLKIIRKYSFVPFGIYCIFIGLISLLVQTAY